MVKNNLILITCDHRNKEGLSTDRLKETSSYQVSIYFDFRNDNHHFLIQKGASREEVIQRLENLIELIKRGRE